MVINGDHGQFSHEVSSTVSGKARESWRPIAMAAAIAMAREGLCMTAAERSTWETTTSTMCTSGLHPQALPEKICEPPLANAASPGSARLRLGYFSRDC